MSWVKKCNGYYLSPVHNEWRHKSLINMINARLLFQYFWEVWLRIFLFSLSKGKQIDVLCLGCGVEVKWLPFHLFLKIKCQLKKDGFGFVLLYHSIIVGLEFWDVLLVCFKRHAGRIKDKALLSLPFIWARWLLTAQECWGGKKFKPTLGVFLYVNPASSV